MRFEGMCYALETRIDCELCEIYLHSYSMNEFELVHDDNSFAHDPSLGLNINGRFSDDDFQKDSGGFCCHCRCF